MTATTSVLSTTMHLVIVFANPSGVDFLEMVEEVSGELLVPLMQLRAEVNSTAHICQLYQYRPHVCVIK